MARKNPHHTELCNTSKLTTLTGSEHECIPKRTSITHSYPFISIFTHSFYVAISDANLCQATNQVLQFLDNGFHCHLSVDCVEFLSTFLDDLFGASKYTQCTFCFPSCMLTTTSVPNYDDIDGEKIDGCALTCSFLIQSARDWKLSFQALFNIFSL